MHLDCQRLTLPCAYCPNVPANFPGDRVPVSRRRNQRWRPNKLGVQNIGDRYIRCVAGTHVGIGQVVSHRTARRQSLSLASETVNGLLQGQTGCSIDIDVNGVAVRCRATHCRTRRIAESTCRRTRRYRSRQLNSDRTSVSGKGTNRPPHLTGISHRWCGRRGNP